MISILFLMNFCHWKNKIRKQSFYHETDVCIYINSIVVWLHQWNIGRGKSVDAVEPWHAKITCTSAGIRVFSSTRSRFLEYNARRVSDYTYLSEYQYQSASVRKFYSSMNILISYNNRYYIEIDIEVQNI